jgi:large subunit ribosomal protein L18
MSIHKEKIKRQKRSLRHGRVRAIVAGTAKRPRLSVFRSGSQIYAQLIDDDSGKTLVATSSLALAKGAKSSNNAGKSAKTDIAAQVGSALAEKAQAAKISAVVFDRGGYKYHGRVKALAEAARAGGLQF